MNHLFAIVLDNVIQSAPNIREPIYGGLRRIVNNLKPHWVTFDLSMWVGRQAYVECLDGGPADLAVTDHPALFTATNADTCERLHLLLPFDPVRAQEASDRAVAVIEATRASEILPRLSDDPNDWRCKMCGHRERCWK